MAQQSFNQPQFSVRRSIASGLLVMETAIALTVVGAFISAPSNWSLNNRATAQTESIQSSDRASSTSAADLGTPLSVDRSTELPPPPPQSEKASPSLSIPVPENPPVGSLDRNHPAVNSKGDSAIGSDSVLLIPADSIRLAHPIQVDLSGSSCNRPDQITLLCIPLEN